MKSFGLIGIGGYIAPRHLRAIKELKHKLVVSIDKNDSVGIIDNFFPSSEFFTNFEQFKRYVKKSKKNQNLDFISICSPNHLHLSHIKFTLQNGINAICEKPLVLKCSELEEIEECEKKYGVRVYSILQLRLHPSIIKLKKVINLSATKKIMNVDLTYLTARGKWYFQSWKGMDRKSGGVCTNIGIHFFDMLNFIFGKEIKTELHYRDEKTCSGFIKYKNARVRWFLSIDPQTLYKNNIQSGKSTYRSIKIEGEEIEFSGKFEDLHTKSYEQILLGNGFGIRESFSAIKTVEFIRNCKPIINPVNHHPFLKEI